MSKHRTIRGLVAGLLGVALLVSGMVVASNMGFKFVPDIPANSAFNLSLPWNNNYTKGSELLNDLPGVTRLQKFNPDSTFTDWFVGASPVQNFDVIKSEAYIANAGSSGSNTAVIVGSHDPNFTLSFNPNEAFNASAPYHQTYTKANELLSDLNGQLGSGAVSRLQKFNADSTFTDWFVGASATQNFNMDLGMGVIVITGNGGSGFAWPHY
ncbi:MAG: hypothetical protein Q9Q40_04640 [Acidobacteriota bacterium]|nr:hypothetical protein [Acidobacteriota bacterium]